MSTVDRLEILPPSDAWSLGNSVGAADLDGDGRDDLLFGIPWWGKGIPGTVFALAYPDRWLSFFPLIGR